MKKALRVKRRSLLKKVKTRSSSERLVALAAQSQSVINAIKQHSATINPELPPEVAAERYGPALQLR